MAKIDCESCDTTGECSECEGTGSYMIEGVEENCGDCQGSGQCSDCDGEGEIEDEDSELAEEELA